MAEATLQVEVRKESGKQAVKRLRSTGMVPGIVYGLEDSPEQLSMNGREVTNMLQKYGRNVLVNLAIGTSKNKTKTFIYEIQHDPMTGAISHVDFKRISLKEKIHVAVPIHLSGIPEGVKTEGGIIEHLMHTVEVSCLPTDIPEFIGIDVSGLHIHDGVRVKDIVQNNFEILSEPDRTVVHIIAPKVVVAAAEAAEGEVAEGLAEPEVIGKKEAVEE
jgi:large subunit ribosomal protein L25